MVPHCCGEWKTCIPPPPREVFLLVQLPSASQGGFLVKSDFFLSIDCVCTSNMLSSQFNL